MVLGRLVPLQFGKPCSFRRCGKYDVKLQGPVEGKFDSIQTTVSTIFSR